MLPLTQYSGLVITFNEAHNINECLASLFRVCDDVVVIDSGSKDNTVDLARAAGAIVLVQIPFLGDGPQRSLGLPLCKHRWVINLDADERLEEDLVAFLDENRNTNFDVDAIECRRRNFIGGRTTHFAGQYPDYICRIFDRKACDFSAVRAHSRIKSNNSKKIKAHITHYSYKNYEDIFSRINLYSSWQAQELASKGAKSSLAAAVMHGGFAFFKHYIIKLGFLAGMDGLTISLSKGLASYLKYAKLIEININSREN